MSFGPNEEAFALEPLNVLIGPNASGKSNLIEALSVLHAAPRDLQVPIREGGGVREWMWKGEPGGFGLAKIEVELTFILPMLSYALAFSEFGGRFRLEDEELETGSDLLDPDSLHHTVYKYRSVSQKPVIETVSFFDNIQQRSQVEMEDVRADQSILSQRRDPESYPEVTYVGRRFQNMAFFREWSFGRFSPARHPQRTDLQQDFLLEDASNLALVLNDMMNRPGLKGQLLEHMRNFYPFIDDINTTIIGGTVQIFFHEKGLVEAIPATRLSDGSLQFLCLLAVLLHPEPPNVICIEEPELGLHPDIIPEVAKLLVEASKRSQIFVTTHSDVLVDALSEVPAAVVVCEKEDGATQLRRLDAESLKPWLEKYRLGELWTSGEIGGNRW